MSTFFVAVKGTRFVATKLKKITRLIKDHPDLYFEDIDQGIIGIKPGFANLIRSQDAHYQNKLPTMQLILEKVAKNPDGKYDQDIVNFAKTGVNEITTDNLYHLDINRGYVIGLTRYGSNNQDVAAALLNELIACDRVICEHDSDFEELLDNTRLGVIQNTVNLVKKHLDHLLSFGIFRKQSL